MSLINDALKRAKQAQQEAQPPSSPNTDLRPIEPRQYARPGVGLAVPALLGLASLVLLVLLWQAAKNGSTNDVLPVNARAKVPGVTTPIPAPIAPLVGVAPPAPAPAPAPVSATPSNTTPVVANDAPTNPVPVVAIAPPAPALPRLQAIVYSTQRPSVMINGKTLFVGDKVGEFRVRAIAQDSVTLVGAGQTNILALPE